MANTDNAYSPLFGGCNWVRKSKAGSQIYRYVCEDRSRVWVVCIAEERDGVEALKSPEDSEPAIWRKADIAGLLRDGVLWRVDERGIPPEMRLAHIPPGEDAELDLKRAVSSYLLETYGCVALMDEKVWKQARLAAIAKFGVARASVAKWFGRHLFYGGHPNACMDHDWHKGGKGKPRRDLVDAEGNRRVMGRPTSAERLDPNTKFKRMPLTGRMKTAWFEFIRREGWASEDSVRPLLQRFKRSRVAYNRGEDGTVQAYPIDPKHFPNDGAMLKAGAPELKKVRRARALARSSLPGHRRVNSGGSAQALVESGLPVFDLDGTLADIRLVFGDDEIYIDGHGKPTVMIAVDRGSGAVVGWYVTFGFENGDCYKNCVFSAYTPKERELERWKVPHLMGMVYGCASLLFLDRGPGIAESVQDAAVDGLRSDSLMARPGDPKGKGHVEQVIGDVQKELGILPGSTHTTGDADVDRLRRKKAKKEAAVTLEMFMRAFLTVISRRNLTMDVRHLMTPEMLIADPPVKPVPADIFAYNKGLQRGDSEWEWTEERIFRTLCDSDEKKAPGGVVSIDKRSYSSLRLKAVAAAYENQHGRETLIVKFLKIPSAPSYLLWEDENGRLDVLQATDETMTAFGDTLPFVHDYISLLKNKALREARHSVRKHPAVEDAVPRGELSEARHKRQLKAESNAIASAGEQSSLRRARVAARRHEEVGHVNAALSVLGIADRVASRPVPLLPRPGRGLLTVKPQSLLDDI